MRKILSNKKAAFLLCLHYQDPFPPRFRYTVPDRYFRQFWASKMPMNLGFECGTCGKGFPAGYRARENHCNLTGHRRPGFECDRCHRYFHSAGARWQHMKERNHFAYECHFCDETWPGEEGLKVHEVEDHHYCADCNRTFQSYNNIQMVSGHALDSHLPRYPRLKHNG